MLFYDNVVAELVSDGILSYLHLCDREALSLDSEKYNLLASYERHVTIKSRASGWVNVQVLLGEQ